MAVFRSSDTNTFSTTQPKHFSEVFRESTVAIYTFEQAATPGEYPFPNIHLGSTH